tara:strand:- start:7692 stop:7907 length:216 start_codon:yes stop_codon:yes gene_type:complete
MENEFFNQVEMEELRVKLYRNSYYIAHREKIQDYQRKYNQFFKKNKFGVVKGEMIAGYKKDKSKAIEVSWD